MSNKSGAHQRLISEFTLQTEQTMILLNSLQADKFDFLREYSDIIKINSLQAGNEENFDKLQVGCDYQLMLNNDEFKNRLLGNTARYNAHVTVKVSQLDALQKLHDELERELGVSHGE